MVVMVAALVGWVATSHWRGASDTEFPHDEISVPHVSAPSSTTDKFTLPFGPPPDEHFVKPIDPWEHSGLTPEDREWMEATPRWVYDEGWQETRGNGPRHSREYTELGMEERSALLRKWRHPILDLPPDLEAPFEQMKAALRTGNDEQAHQLLMEITSRLEDEKRTGAGEVRLTYDRLQGERAARENAAIEGRTLPEPELNGTEAKPVLDRLSLDQIAAMLVRPQTVVEGQKISAWDAEGYLHDIGTLTRQDGKGLVLSPAARDAIHAAIESPPKRDTGQTVVSFLALIRLLPYSRGRDEVPYLLSLLARTNLSDQDEAERARDAAMVLDAFIRPLVPLAPEDIAAVKAAWEAHPDVLATAPGIQPGLETLRLLMNLVPPEENYYFTSIVDTPERYNGPTRAQVLTRLRPWEPAEQTILVRLLRTDPSPEVRVAATAILGKAPEGTARTEARALLRQELLSNSSPEARKTIVSVFRGIVEDARHEDVSGYLSDMRLAAKQDPDPGVRSAAESELRQMEAWQALIDSHDATGSEDK